VSSTVCIDASLALMWLLPVQESDKADALRMNWYKHDTRLVTPPLFHAEVTSVLRLRVHNKQITVSEGEEVFRYYEELGIETYDHPSITRTAWNLARRYNLSRTYDAQYLAVAELLDCQMWTNDRKLINSVNPKSRHLRWVGEFEG